MSEALLPEAPARASTGPAVRRLALPLGAAAGVTALASANGGYFPTSWGWSALVLFWVAGVALLARPTLALPRLELAALAALVALVGWIWASSLWSPAMGQSVLEGQRSLIYVAGVAAALLAAGRSSGRPLLGGVLAGIVAVSSYGLATRLFPERLGTFDSVAGYRLSEPLGYWNALGIFAALGVLLALGFSAHARTPLGRAVAAAILVVLAPTIYFTFSRGAWIALGIGLAAAVTLDPRRVRLATGLLVAAPAPALAVWLASQSDALTRRRAPLPEATRDGHRLALWLLALAALAVLLSLARDFLDRRLAFGPIVRRAWGGALALVVLGAVVALFAYFGGPIRTVERAYDAFTAPPPRSQPDLSKRLFSFSGTYRADLWRAAWRQFEERPWAGSGAGSYEQYWYQHRKIDLKVRDAHSLYFETLAELGIVGLGLLVLVLGVPLAAAVRARANRLVPAAFGAYVAYLAHAGVDWDWETSAVTLTALLCGAACLLAARREGEPPPLRSRVRAGALAGTVALSAVAFVGLVGNGALTKSREALLAGRPDIAETQARRAIRWAPWSAEAWQRLGEAHAAFYEPRRARDAFRKALEKDPRNWLLWYELAGVTPGAERRQLALAVVRLNPRSAEAAEMRKIAGL